MFHLKNNIVAERYTYPKCSAWWIFTNWTACPHNQHPGRRVGPHNTFSLWKGKSTMSWAVHAIPADCLFMASLVVVLFAQLCLTLCDPMDCNLPGSSVHGILQARILEWAAIPFSRGSSRPRDQTQVSCAAGRFFSVLLAGSVPIMIPRCLN